MYLSIYVINVTALIYLTRLISAGTALNSSRKKPFLACITLIILMIISEASTIYSMSSSFSRIIHIAANVIGFSLTPIVPLVITMIFDRRIISTHKRWLIPTVLNAVVTFLSPRFGFIFYVDAGNHYYRGRFFFVFIVVYVINYLFFFVTTIDVSKRRNYPIVRKMTALSIFTVIGTSIQVYNPNMYVSWHSITLALFLYYILMSEFDCNFDILTGLYNRAAFTKAAEQLVNTESLSIIIIDINDFKAINDTYGHGYGDKVLQIIASVVRTTFTNHYKCYRYGGDEFAILSSEVDHESLEKDLKSMISTLSAIRERGTVVPTVSYGYKIAPKGLIVHFEKLLKDADAQMYQYKKALKAKKPLEHHSSNGSSGG